MRSGTSPGIDGMPVEILKCFKSDSRSLTDNYRGISLLTCINYLLRSLQKG